MRNALDRFYRGRLLIDTEVTTRYLWAGIVVWEMKIKNLLNAFGSIQLRYKQLKALMGD